MIGNSFEVLNLNQLFLKPNRFSLDIVQEKLLEV